MSTSIESSVDLDEIRIALNENELNDIELVYQTIIKEAKVESILHRFENNINVIYNGFQRLLRNEGNLYSKLMILKNDFRDINLKFEQALKLSSIDQKSKSDLLEELDKAWNHANLAKSKEKRALETLKSLKLEVFNLSKLVEQDVGFTMGQEYNLREIIKEKENLLFDNNNLSNQMNELTIRLKGLEEKDTDYAKMSEEHRVKETQTKQEIYSCNLELQKLTRKNEQLQEELLNQRRQTESKDASLVKLNQSVQTQKSDMLNYEQTIKDLNLTVEKTKKELDIQNTRFQRAQNELDQQFIRNDSLSVENSHLIQQEKKHEETIENLRFDLSQVQKKRDINETKIKCLEEQKRDVQSEKSSLAIQLDSSNKLIEKLKKESENDKRQLDGVLIEKDQLINELTKVNTSFIQLENTIRSTNIQLNRIESEKKSLEKEISKLKSLISGFDKERNTYLERANEFSLKLNKQSDELHVAELNLSESLKKISKYDVKLIQMQRLYENVRSDRNLYSKNLLESQEEIKILRAKIESLKSDMQNLSCSCQKKEADLNLVSVEKIKLEKNFTQLRAQTDQRVKEISDLKQEISHFESTKTQLLKMIKDSENANYFLQKHQDKLIVERNVLGSQLVRRNDEICLLYEKTRLLDKILAKGQLCYNVLKQDLKKANLQLNELRKEVEIKDKSKMMVKELKKDLMLSEKDLLVEKRKRNAVEKLQNELNIHRWRKLKGCDPSTYELVLKVSMLQKRLIHKSEEVSILHLRFQEKDQMFLEIKKYFSRRLIETETADIILEYKTSLKSSNNKLKVKLDII